MKTFSLQDQKINKIITIQILYLKTSFYDLKIKLKSFLKSQAPKRRSIEYGYDIQVLRQ